MFFVPSKLFPKLAFQSLRTGSARRTAHHRSRLSSIYHAALYRTEQLEDRTLLSAGPWFDLAQLSSPNFADGNVAIDGDTIVTGSAIFDSLATEAGVAHVYQRDDSGTPSDPGDDRWPLLQELVPSDLNAYDHFGTNVAISGNTLVVTARHPTVDNSGPVPGDGLGVAYVYERNAVTGTWELQQKLEPSERVEVDSVFGWGVAMEGDLIAVTAPWEDHILPDSTVLVDAGAVYLYRRDAQTGVWAEEARIVDPDTQIAISREGFGGKIDIDQGEIVLGVSHGDGDVIDSGTVQVFAESAPGEWTQSAEFWAINGEADSRFGSAVSKEDDTIVVGSDIANFGVGDQAGAAYVFVRDGNGIWTQEAKLFSSDLEADDFFGRSAVINNQTIAVGSWHGNGVIPDTGAVYIFERDAGTWVESDKIIELHRSANEETLHSFGERLAWDGDQMVIANHRVGLLSRTIRDSQTLRLIELILRSGDGVLADEATQYWFPGDDLLSVLRPRGLPIGNLTSQFFANVFLDPADHFIKEELRVPGYVRYADDLLLFGHTKRQLWQWRDEITNFLGKQRLQLHAHKTHVCPSIQGVSFLGFRLFRSGRRLKQETITRFNRRLRKLRWLRGRREIGFDRIQASLRAWLAHSAHANTAGIRRALWHRVRF